MATNISITTLLPSIPADTATNQHVISADDLENATKAVYMVVVFPLSLFLNVGVIRAYLARPSNISVFIQFSINLTMACIVPTLLLLPLLFAAQLNAGSWPIYISGCQYATFILHVSNNAIYLTLSWMHMDRYLAYSFPDQYHLRMPSARGVFLCIICWLISIAFTIPYAVNDLNWAHVAITRNNTNYPVSTVVDSSLSCDQTKNDHCKKQRLDCIPWPEDQDNYLIFAVFKGVLLYGLPLVLFIFCQVKIMQSSRKTLKTSQGRGHLNSLTLRRPSSRNKVESSAGVARSFSVLTTIEISFLIFCLPLMIISYIGNWIQPIRGLHSIDGFIVLLNSTFYIIMPLCILARDRLMRRKFKRVHQCLFEHMQYNKSVKWHHHHGHHSHHGHHGHHHHHHHHQDTYPHDDDIASQIHPQSIDPLTETTHCPEPSSTSALRSHPQAADGVIGSGAVIIEENDICQVTNKDLDEKMTGRNSTAVSMRKHNSGRGLLSTISSVKSYISFRSNERRNQAAAGEVNATAKDSNRTANSSARTSKFLDGLRPPKLYGGPFGIRLQVDTANAHTAEGWRTSEMLSGGEDENRSLSSRPHSNADSPVTGRSTDI